MGRWVDGTNESIESELSSERGTCHSCPSIVSSMSLVFLVCITIKVCTSMDMTEVMFLMTG